MISRYLNHNLARQSTAEFLTKDPQLASLAKLKYQFKSLWWQGLDLNQAGLYILTGGRQVGKSTSCKLLMAHCLKKKLLKSAQLFYLPCDEIYDAKEFSHILRLILAELTALNAPFLLIIDEVTYVKDWDRVIKALADEGIFQRGICLLTGSDSIILKEAAQRFPGRRGQANQTDFHMHPLSFSEYVYLVSPKSKNTELADLFKLYLQCGGYLKAINDFAEKGTLSESTFFTYEQWIRGDFLKQGKSEETLLAVLRELILIGVSPISYTKLNQKIGVISKETCIDYLRLLGRMDILITLQAYDQNKKVGFPRKDRKFHFADPFIFRTVIHWLNREGYLGETVNESNLVEACVASFCARLGKVFYFKGQGEIDVISLRNNQVSAIEVKWAEQIRANDLKTLKQFPQACILTKYSHTGKIDGINHLPVYQFLMALSSV